MRTISAVLCAYNEAALITNILDVVTAHPLISQVLVVNDGSTDTTLALLTHYPAVEVLSYTPNRGKTYALGRGIERATGELILLLDTDLTGIQIDDISALIQPVLSDEADVSFSLRGNSLALYRALALDFVTGERVLPRMLAREFMQASITLPRWGGEVYMNTLIIRDKMRLAVVPWRKVMNVRKYEKLGRFEGTREEWRMLKDAASVIGIRGAVLQNIRLLALRRHR